MNDETTAAQELDGSDGVLSEADLDEARAYRERAFSEGFLESSGPSDRDLMARADVAAIPPDQISRLYSQRSYDFIIDHEVSGRAGYDKKFRKAIWPGKDSGITIGVGYDLGYNEPEDFEADWKALLPPETFSRLLRTSKKKRGEAKACLDQLAGIEIDWHVAETVFKTVTVPKFSRLVIATFPNARELDPHAFGALLSLVYNRGGKLTGSKRTHMLAIRDAMAAKRYNDVPQQFLLMRQLWPEYRGLRIRRAAEAKLFEDGLVEMNCLRNPAAMSAAQTTQGGVSTSLESIQLGGQDTDDGEGDWAGREEDITEDMEAVIPSLPSDELESAPAGWRAVAWVSNDDNSTEYRHILATDRQLAGCSFTFTSRDLELLIRSNSFEPGRDNKRIIFGLRGAVLEADVTAPGDGDMQVERAALRLKDTRPDHKNFQCVIGVYNLETGKLSGFKASTVPNRAGVWDYTQPPHKSGNMLPAGCYLYSVGTHRKTTPGCLREAEPFTVLRSKTNLAYDIGDDWNKCLPWDNIHPSFVDKRGSASFSSLGCQVVRGSYNKATGQYTREWAHFRRAIGLSPNGRGDDGKKFSYVLLTGMEAAIAARLRDQGKDTDFNSVFASLVRLRQGSRGEPVRRLQTALGLASDGILAAPTKKAFADHQRAKGLAADGVYAPAHDTLLGLAVLGSGPVAVALVQTGKFTESMGTGSALGPAAHLESLYAEIGRRSQIAAINPGLAALPDLPHYENMTTESLADAFDIGKRIFARLERSVHELLCGDAAEDSADRQNLQKTLLDASKISDEAVIKSLADFISSSLVIMGPIAMIVAKIIVEKVLGPTLADARNKAIPLIGCACNTWAKILNDRHGDQATQRISLVQALTSQTAAEPAVTVMAGTTTAASEVST